MSNKIKKDSKKNSKKSEKKLNPVKSPLMQHDIVKGVLENHGWSVTVDESNRDILMIDKGESYYMLYFFYGDSESQHNWWMADEEINQYADSLWTSSEKSAISPIYRLNNLKKFYDDMEIFEAILVLASPCRIVNTNSYVESLTCAKVITSRRLLSLICDNKLYRFDTDYKDITRNVDFYPYIEEKWYDDKDLFLKEFISHIVEQNNNELEESIRNLSTEGRIRYAVANKDEDIDKVKPTINSYFRPIHDKILVVDITLKEAPLRDVKITVDICADEKFVEIDDYLLKGQIKKRFCIPVESITAQNNYLHVKNSGKLITTGSLSIVKYQEDVKNEIELIGFSLTRVDSGDIMLGMQDYVARHDQIIFDNNNLAGIFLMAIFKNISAATIDYQFTLLIVDSSGEYVYEAERSGCLIRNEDFNFWYEINEEIIKKGNYQMLIYHCDQLIAKTAITICDRDLQCSKILSLVQKGLSGMKMTTLNGYSNSDNMDRLNGMIGLTEVKKQLRKLIARTRLEKLRKEQNLPTSNQQLHLAFLGNPGTGKTTVAKLLGEIYKEIGVLSSGDVLVRDRSTLSGQNWGSEGELVNQAIEQSAGGVLFIDEAYDIVTEHRNDPGKLIISTLLGEMSNESKRDWMVIFAGYTQQMEKFLSKNPGLRSRLKVIHFNDYNVEELMQVADLWLEKNFYNFTDEARKYFETVVANAYSLRDENFGNARYVINLLETEIQPAMAERIMSQETFFVSLDMLTTIEAIDIPNYHTEQENASEAIKKLNSMVGLGELKKKISSHLSYIRFVNARRDNNIATSIAPLHMIFTGNPGTGKTSVADYLGDIYHSIGILSIGNVIKVSRADMIGSVIGETEEKMKNLLATAQGNILFIDEAYTLYNASDRDFGKIAIETLLDTLGKESTNMIVIMAGYSKEMEELLNSNPGIKGRFPYKFHFEDYNEDELLEIADIVVHNNNLTMTSTARDAIKAIIRKECKTKDSNFSNGRFVVRLITTQVIPNMACRLEGESDKEKLCTIIQEDIPINQKNIAMINDNLFDEHSIEQSLQKLDSMVGLSKAKAAIHQFVEFARNLNKKEPAKIECYPLKWSFIGNTGTGKSSVAEILAQILKAMNLLAKGHTVEIKAEEIYGVTTHKADELIQQRMKESLQGLLFVDGDAPQFKSAQSNFTPDYLRVCLATNTNEIRGNFAVVIAEHDSPRVGLAKSLNQIGINNFDQTLIFEDYTTDELLEILSQQLGKQHLTLLNDAKQIMRGYIIKMSDHSNNNDANARTMTQLAQAISSMLGAETTEISAEMVAKFATIESGKRTKIGF